MIAMSAVQDCDTCARPTKNSDYWLEKTRVLLWVILYWYMMSSCSAATHLETLFPMHAALM
jgi:hypothetical protein